MVLTAALRQNGGGGRLLAGTARRVRQNSCCGESITERRPPMLRSRIALCLLTSLVMVVSGSGVAPGVVPSAISQPAAIAIAESEADLWLHTEGSEIVTPSGDDFTIRAVNWFGMETSNCAPHGLWQISLDQAMDQIASFGFNTIRLPYSSECLAGTAGSVSGVDSRLNPEIAGADSAADHGQGGRRRGRPKPPGAAGSASPGLRLAVRIVVHRPIFRAAVDRRLGQPGHRYAEQSDRHRCRPAQRAARPGLLGVRRSGGRLGGCRDPRRRRGPRREPALA